MASGRSEVSPISIDRRPVQGKAPVTLRTYALGAMATLVRGSGSLAKDTPEAGFLLAHLHATDQGGTGWTSSLVDYLRFPAPADGALLRLAADLELSAIEALVVALAVAVEDDAMVGRALAFLQSPVGGSRCSPPRARFSACWS